MSRLTAVLPLKALRAAKGRLAPDLAPLQRRDLVTRMLAVVAAAARGATSVERVVVVAGDADAAAAAHGLDLEVFADPGSGLNAAIRSADATLGNAPTIVLAADLPEATAAAVDHLAGLLPRARPAVLVAPTVDGGTGALLRAPGGLVAPAYGPGSCAAHLRAARDTGVWAARIHVPELARDVDRLVDAERVGLL